MRRGAKVVSITDCEYGVGDGGDDGDGDDDEMRGEKEGEDMVGVAGLPKGDVGTCSYKAPMIMVMTMMVMMVMMTMMITIV